MATKLTWYARLDTDAQFTAAKEIFAGTYTKYHDIVATVQLWNNRYGTEDVDALQRFSLQLGFEDIEDSKLLPYLSVSMNGANLETNIVNDYVIITLPADTVLYGTANNGVTAENKGNYIELTITFHAENVNLKENDLKSLYLTVVSL